MDLIWLYDGLLAYDTCASYFSTVLVRILYEPVAIDELDLEGAVILYFYDIGEGKVLVVRPRGSLFIVGSDAHCDAFCCFGMLGHFSDKGFSFELTNTLEAMICSASLRVTSRTSLSSTMSKVFSKSNSFFILLILF